LISSSLPWGDGLPSTNALIRFNGYGGSSIEDSFYKNFSFTSKSLSSQRSQPWYRKPFVWLGILGSLCIADAISISLRHGKGIKSPSSFFTTWQNTYKSRVESGMSLLLKGVPNSVYRRLEEKYCYHGAQAVELTHEFQRSLGHQVQEVFFISAKKPGNKLRAWHVNAKNGKPTILFSMGSGGCTLEMMGKYKNLLDEGYGFFAYEYPGYGKSEGKANEQALYDSLHAASAHLKNLTGNNQVPVNQQIFYGVSLGGPVATQVAKDLTEANTPPIALIFGSTMTNFSEVVKRTAAEKLPWLPSWLLPIHKQMPSKFDTLSKIGSVTCPTLILHSKSDTTMPYEFAESLHERAGTAEAKKRLVEVQGNHMDSLASSEGIQAIQEFLQAS
jgi:alpha-beta hydrolase superfamily lysophospholipase